MRVKINNSFVELKRGDITLEDTDALVNAANSGLRGGGGVDGAMHRAGGPEIMAECRAIGKCSPGNAVITTGGRLKARRVIHTVGPIYNDGEHNEAQILSSAYKASLELAAENGLSTVAFPSISTGAYGYPIEEAATIALSAVADFLRKTDKITLVRFVLFSDADLKTYEKALARIA
jgi:O-acetyl-ADP-ribose deacetylase (regulator of RNase III)